MRQIRFLALFCGLLVALAASSQTVIHRDTKVSVPKITTQQMDLHDSFQPSVISETPFGLEKLQTDTRVVERNGVEYRLPGTWKPIESFAPGAYVSSYIRLQHERDSFKQLSEHLIAESIPLAEALHERDSIKELNDSLSAALERPGSLTGVPDTTPTAAPSPPVSTGMLLFLGGTTLAWILTPAFLPSAAS